MECKANLLAVSNDILTGKVILQFSTDKTVLDCIEDIQNKDLRLNAKKWAEKRSLDANAYLWLLVTKIAEKINSSKDEVYEEMLQRYGKCYEDDNGLVTITVKSCVNMDTIAGHWKFIKESKDGKFKSYLMIKGTSEYDSKEMHYLLSMIVEEAKGLGIETMTTQEIKELAERWQIKNLN